MEVYGLDNGYFNTKAVGGNIAFLFRSRIKETTEDHINGTILEYEGKAYKIGEGTDDIEIRKTEGLVHKICTLAALARITEDTGEYKIVVGLPLQHYKNREFREEFREYMAKPIIHRVRYNGQKKNIIINDVLVFAQGAAALYANDPARYKGKIVGIVDIGGLTVNGCIFENLQAVPETMFTIHNGTIILYSKIKSALNEAFCLNIQDYEIPYLLLDKSEYQPIINRVIEEYFMEIKKEMRRKNWSIETINMLGVGGGVIVTKNTIQKYLPNLEIANNPIYANAIGLYNIGRMMWR